MSKHMHFKLKLCLEKTDNDHVTVPFDYSINSKWSDIEEKLKNEYDGQVVNGTHIVFYDEKNLKLFFVYYAHLYAGIPL